eukprot:3002387-Rhodomonas_salina.1
MERGVPGSVADVAGAEGRARRGDDHAAQGEIGIDRSPQRRQHHSCLPAMQTLLGERSQTPARRGDGGGDKQV